MRRNDRSAEFTGELVEWGGASAWHFVHVPEELAPDFTGAFGRVPVVATVDDVTWETSVWHDKNSGWLLAVPKKVRRTKRDGDVVTVAFTVDDTRL